jgi:deoxyribonuclease V
MIDLQPHAPWPGPLCVLDVDYDDVSGTAKAAAVCVDHAGVDAARGAAFAVDVDGVAPYQPGAFFLRELPCLLAVLAQASVVDGVALVVDGYVVLDDDGKPGLGMRLHEATGRPVIGIAKTSFKGSRHARAVLRGRTATRPLYVTAAGVDVDVAAATVLAMHGLDRLPTAVVHADHVARGRLAPHARAV